MEKKEFDQATEELDKATELDDRDPWLHYYKALVKYRQREGTGESFRGLANMIQDLRAVLDWDPDFAEAYNLLAMARLDHTAEPAQSDVSAEYGSSLHGSEAMG